MVLITDTLSHASLRARARQRAPGDSTGAWLVQGVGVGALLSRPRLGGSTPTPIAPGGCPGRGCELPSSLCGILGEGCSLSSVDAGTVTAPPLSPWSPRAQALRPDGLGVKSWLALKGMCVWSWASEWPSRVAVSSAVMWEWEEKARTPRAWQQIQTLYLLHVPQRLGALSPHPARRGTTGSPACLSHLKGEKHPRGGEPKKVLEQLFSPVPTPPHPTPTHHPGPRRREPPAPRVFLQVPLLPLTLIK